MKHRDGIVLRLILMFAMVVGIFTGIVPGTSMMARADGYVASVTVSGTTTNYITITDAVSAWNAAGAGATLKLLADVEITSAITVTSGTAESPMVLDLNGYGIRANGNDLRLIIIRNGANLTINDSNLSAVHGYKIESPTDNGAGLAVVNSTKQSDDTEFTGGYITGGYITGGNGGGIYIENGTLNMRGGSIIGNHCNNTGGGIYVAGGSKFYMTDGSLIGNTAEYGGGIGSAAPKENGATVIELSGGLIAYNKTTGTGGGVHGNANNSTTTKRIDLTITGTVTIENNHTDGDWNKEGNINAGGGIVVDGSGHFLTLSGSPTIRGNKAGNGTSRPVVDNNIYFTNRGNPKAGIGEFTPVAPVGVTMGTAGVFTNSTDTDNNDVIKFTSDNMNCGVIKNDSNQLELVLGHTVTYDYATNGGTETTKTTAQIEVGDNIDLKPVATKEGWNFVGWNTDPNATDALDSLAMGTSNVTLYAIFSKTLTGTFYSGANAASTESVTIYNTADSGSITAPAPADKAGWTAVGWNTSDSAYTSSVNAGSNVTLTKNTNYYGIYSQTITVSYDADGGSSTPELQEGTQYVNVHDTDTYLNPTFTLAAAITKADSTFDKWSDGTETYNAGDEITLSSSKTLTAQWGIITKGVYIRMGAYNGYDVDWFCARVNGTGTMMLSKYVIKTSRFGANATYATSDVHSWLDIDSGGTFATDLGLTKDDLSLVRTVDLSGSNGDGTDSFIIPAYGNNEQNKGTPYTQAGYINNPESICSIYWLRSPRDTGNVRVVKSQDATVAARYSGATYGGRGIRPMFYLDTDAIKNMSYTGSGTEADPYVFEARYKVDSNVSQGGSFSVSAKLNDIEIYKGKFEGNQNNKLVKDAQVTLTTNPASGYELRDLSVLNKTGKQSNSFFYCAERNSRQE